VPLRHHPPGRSAAALHPVRRRGDQRLAVLTGGGAAPRGVSSVSGGLDMVGKFRRAAAGLGLALLAFGCGGTKWSMNDTVEGTVTLDGTPLATVFVQFVPDADPTARQAPSSGAYTD